MGKRSKLSYRRKYSKHAKTVVNLDTICECEENEEKEECKEDKETKPSVPMIPPAVRVNRGEMEKKRVKIDKVHSSWEEQCTMLQIPVDGISRYCF